MTSPAHRWEETIDGISCYGAKASLASIISYCADHDLIYVEGMDRTDNVNLIVKAERSNVVRDAAGKPLACVLFLPRKEVIALAWSILREAQEAPG